MTISCLLENGLYSLLSVTIDGDYNQLSQEEYDSIELQAPGIYICCKEKLLFICNTNIDVFDAPIDNDVISIRFENINFGFGSIRYYETATNGVVYNVITKTGKKLFSRDKYLDIDKYPPSAFPVSKYIVLADQIVYSNGEPFLWGETTYFAFGDGCAIICCRDSVLGKGKYYAILHSNGELYYSGIDIPKWMSYCVVDDNLILFSSEGGARNPEAYQHFILTDIKFKVIKEFRAQSCDNYCENLFVVRIDGKYGFIDSCGQFVIAPLYDWVYNFFNEVSLVRKGNSVLTIDKKGETITDFSSYFTDALSTIIWDREEMGFVKFLNGKIVGLLDLISGEVLHIGLFNQIKVVSHDRFIVSIGDELVNRYYGVYSLIDRGGNKLCPMVFSFMDKLTPYYLVVVINNKHGIMDVNGRIVIEPKYDYIFYENQAVFLARLGSKHFYVNFNGVEYRQKENLSFNFKVNGDIIF